MSELDDEGSHRPPSRVAGRKRLRGNREETAEPDGASSAEEAGKLFYKAYARQDREAAAGVATDAAIGKLRRDGKSGLPEGLELMDPIHIYYMGGSIGMKIKKNAEGAGT